MRFSRALLTVLLILVSLNAELAAQVTGRLSGVIVDPSGARIPGASIKVMLPDVTEAVMTTISNDEGLFGLTGIRPAAYDVVIELPGFRKYTQRGIVISPAQETALGTIRLEIGNVSEEVEVTASETAVQTVNAEVSVNISRNQVKELPVLNRSPMSFIQTQAGVSSGRGTTVINGMRTSLANVTLDGINIQDNYIRTNALDFLPNMLLIDQVAEVTVATSNTNNSVGGAAAQVMFVTPSGTNRFTGSAFWSNRNNALAANTWFNNRDGNPRPFLNQNQAGGSVGGPILRNKLFFYTNYEAYRSHQQSTQNRTILTADARQGIFTYRDTNNQVRKINVLQAAGVSVDPAMQAIVQQVSGPERINNFRVGDSTDTLLRNTAGYSLLMRNNRIRDHVTGKLDYTVSTRHNLSGTFVWNSDIIDRPDLGSSYTTVPKVTNDDHATLVSIGWRWNPSPWFTNEARGGFNLAPITFNTSQQFRCDARNQGQFCLSTSSRQRTLV